MVPPPEARVDGFLGHQPIALTAAVCSWNLINYPCFSCEYTKSLLSFPPEAMNLPSGLHFSPHIYCECARYLLIFPNLTSQMPTFPSFDPLARMFLPQLRLPIRPVWALILLTLFFLTKSTKFIYPKVFPTAIVLFPQKATEQISSSRSV